MTDKREDHQLSDSLGDQLLKAAEEFSATKDGDKSIDAQRRGAQQALVYVIEALRNSGYTPRHLKPLWELASALSDLQTGFQPAMLTKVTRSDASRRPNTRTARYVSASHLVDILMGKGKNIEAACREVARLFEKHNIPFPGKDETTGWKAVRGFIYNARYNKPSNSTVILMDYWDDYLKTLSPDEAEDVLRADLSLGCS